MLPKELSNGICSLNPGEDRLAFSALITLDGKAQIVDYTFQKTVIRSRVKGVYTEINALLEGNAPAGIEEKYRELTPQLGLMKELAEKLIENRRQRGAPEIETAEGKSSWMKKTGPSALSPASAAFPSG